MTIECLTTNWNKKTFRSVTPPLHCRGKTRLCGGLCGVWCVWFRRRVVALCVHTTPQESPEVAQQAAAVNRPVPGRGGSALLAVLQLWLG